jgi:hypothetical protein
MDPNKILLLLKFTKQLHKALKEYNNSDTFETINQIRTGINTDDFLRPYLSKLNDSEKLYLFFSIFYYHRTNDAVKSLEYVLKNLKGYQFYVCDQNGYATDECPDCNGSGREDCNNCDGDGYISCRACGGDGNEDCRDCGGSGEDEEGNACDSCDGDGTEDCSECNGSGNEMCDQCNGDGYYDCDYCNGNGEMETDVMEYEENKHDIYTTNKFDKLISNSPFELSKYESVVLKQPFYIESDYVGTDTIEDIFYNWGLDVELEKFKNGFVIYNRELSL